MTQTTTTRIRVGQSDVSQEAGQTHTLNIFVKERPGAVDRVVGVLRRRRASPSSLTLAQTSTAGIVRISAQVKDSEVGIDQLVEQIRKIVDVQQIQNLTAQEAITRELALIQINVTEAQRTEITAAAQGLGASVIEVGTETVTLEVAGEQAKVEAVIAAFAVYDICEIARSSAVTMVRTVAR